MAKQPRTRDTQVEGGGEATVSKVKAIGEALRRGHDSPSDGVAFIKEEYGLEIRPQYFSSVKLKLKQKQGKPGARSAGSQDSGAVDGYLAPPPKPRDPGDPDVLLALEQVKDLVAEHGAEKVRKMIDLLS